MKVFCKCAKCGKNIVNIQLFQNEPYGFDCFQKVAKEFIKKRDAILDDPKYWESQEENLKKLDELANQYGVK